MEADRADDMMLWLIVGFTLACLLLALIVIAIVLKIRKLGRRWP